MTSIFTPSNHASNVAERDAAVARADEQARQGRITDGTNAINSTFGQFDDNFYGGRQKAYTDYATPQLTSQYDKAKQQLTFALARDGSLDSSTRSAREAQLQETYDTAKRGVADQAVSYGNTARNSVEDARASLISTLNGSGDAAQAANGAVSRAQALSSPAAFSPLGDLFSSFTSALGTQAAAEKATAATGGQLYKSPYNTGLFSSASSVKNN